MSIIVQEELDKYLQHEYGDWDRATTAYHAGIKCCARLLHKGVPISVILSAINDEPLYSIGDKVYLKDEDIVGEIVAKNVNSRYWIIRDKDNFGMTIHDSGFCHLREWTEE